MNKLQWLRQLRLLTWIDCQAFADRRFSTVFVENQVDKSMNRERVSEDQCLLSYEARPDLQVLAIKSPIP